jgi:hypothetical protein
MLIGAFAAHNDWAEMHRSKWTSLYIAAKRQYAALNLSLEVTAENFKVAEREISK